MDVPEFEDLLARYFDGNCSPEEVTLLRHWYFSYEMKDLPELTDEQINEVVEMKLPVHVRKIAFFKIWLPAAAGLLLFSTLGLYILTKNRHTTQVAYQQSTIMPGGNIAILTLGNGKKIALNSVGNGQLASQGKVKINKAADGLLEYLNAENATKFPAETNNITTPAGGEYHLVLSDGSSVWLNSSSSITFPVTFNGNKREVEITGEAYFEVKHDKTKPFRVVCDGQVTEVLGTHFNINDYKDNGKIITTLLQGSVKISKNRKEALLSPGEQAEIGGASEKDIDVVTNADAELAIAWKNGLFKFNKAKLKDVMHQLGRWYDFDVRYVGQIKDRQFSGEITRSADISEVLGILSLLKINFKISSEGQRDVITVFSN